ncbi:MAG: hypothetical protein HKN20_14015 [Gemmatimonadetes bacterium]|nr:hypothetical protein [Gemmatimonadota bacterium]
MTSSSRESVQASLFPFTVEVAVRGYEIDAYGHTKNSVYMNWLEHALWEIGRMPEFAKPFEGIQTVARNLKLEFVTETKLGDRLAITLWPRAAGNTSFTTGAEIRIIESDDAARRGAVAMKASIVQVCVRRGVGKVPFPEAARRHIPANDPGEVPPLRHSR